MLGLFFVAVLTKINGDAEMRDILLSSWNSSCSALFSPNQSITCCATNNITALEVDSLLKTARTISSVSEPRLEATFHLAKAALSIPGDFVETGLYTGGSASIMIKMLLNGDQCQPSRLFHGFDSFEGFPEPGDEDYQGVANHGFKKQFMITQQDFQSNLMKVGLDLNSSTVSAVVRVTKGWFNDTCPVAPINNISFLRLDGDLFVSTWDPLMALYDKVSPGGLIYVDDYGSFNGCRVAIDKFRLLRRIYAPLHFIREDKGHRLKRVIFEAVWWRKGEGGGG